MRIMGGTGTLATLRFYVLHAVKGWDSASDSPDRQVYPHSSNLRKAKALRRLAPAPQTMCSATRSAGTTPTTRGIPGRQDSADDRC